MLENPNRERVQLPTPTHHRLAAASCTGSPVEHPALTTNRGVALSENQNSLKIADIRQDVGVLDVHDRNAFIAAAKTHQWEREKAVRTLA
jgi:hypothetical protein